MGPVKGQLSNLLGDHAVFAKSDPDIQFGSGAPATEDTPLISFDTVELGAVRSARMGPDPARALGGDEVDDHALGASLVRWTPRPDRVLEHLKVASIVESVGRGPTGSGAPSTATSATSGEAKAKVKRNASGKGQAMTARTVSGTAVVEAKRAVSGSSWSRHRAPRRARPRPS